MIVQDTNPPTDGQCRRFQFSLRGLMVVVFGAAIGLSMVKMHPAGWAIGLLGAAGVWMVLGLMAQAVDLWGTFHGRTDLSPEQRWGWRYAVFWRVGAAGLLVGYYGVSALLALGWIELPELEESFRSSGADLRSALAVLALVFIVWSVLPRSAGSRRGLGSGLLDLGGVVAALVLGVVICWRETVIQALVTIAVQGIEMAQPVGFAPEGVEALPGVRTARWFRECSLALALGLTSLGLTCALARQWLRGRWRRRIWGGLLAVALPISTAYFVWLLAVGMPRALPVMIEAQRAEVHVSVTVALLMLVVVTAATYRLVACAAEPRAPADLDWRRNPRRYYQERSGVILLVGLGILAPMVAELVAYRGMVHNWLEVVMDLVYMGNFLLQMALLPVAACAMWTRIRGKIGSQQGILPELSLPHFATIWLALFVTLGTVVPALILFGFSLWFSPWCRAMWP